VQAQWDADVTAGRLTAAEEAKRLTNLRIKPEAWITVPLGQSVP
jgi:hypothetical protein